MRQAKTLKQCEKIAQDIIETMYHVAFINNEELEFYISSGNGKICIHEFTRGVVPSEFKEKKNIKKLCESYFYDSPFGLLLDVPDEDVLAKKIYNYQKKEVE